MPDVTQRAFSYRDDPAVPGFDDTRPLFVFDGVCVLCSAGTRWLLKRHERMLITTVQRPLGAALCAHYAVDPDKTYLLVIDGRAYSESAGYLRLCRELGGAWHLLRVGALVPELLRDALYRWVARNRYNWFGTARHCERLEPAQRERVL